MLKYLWHLVTTGFWMGLGQGFGIELSFLGLWVSWHFLHGKVAHKLDPEHVFHRIHDYFTK
jgi:hypothetical protein